MSRSKGARALDSLCTDTEGREAALAGRSRVMAETATSRDRWTGKLRFMFSPSMEVDERPIVGTVTNNRHGSWELG
jgi:hypothetical protein